MKIGITERGDAAIDKSWVEKLSTVDGVVVITKNISKWLALKLLELNGTGYSVMLHATTTGWGGTQIEPNVPEYKVQLRSIKKLVDFGFTAERIVLRIDPIIPTEEGIERAKSVIQEAFDLGILPKCRVRFSIIDDYKHVKERFRAAGLPTIYPDGQFTAGTRQFMDVAHMLSQFGIPFESCAEPKLQCSFIKAAGCISAKDTQILGLDDPDTSNINRQNRHGCLCLGCKTELLNRRYPCPHKCMYCYWKDK